MTSIAFSPDGVLLASGGRDGGVRLWDGRTGEGLARFQASEGGVTSIAFSTDGSLLAAACMDGTVRLWGGK